MTDYYAIMSPHGYVVCVGYGYLQCIDKYLDEMRNMGIKTSWQNWRKIGFRCKPVRITQLQELAQNYRDN